MRNCGSSREAENHCTRGSGGVQLGAHRALGRSQQRRKAGGTLAYKTVLQHHDDIMCPAKTAEMPLRRKLGKGMSHLLLAQAFVWGATYRRCLCKN